MDKIIEKFGAEDINIKIANTNELLEDINSGSVDFALVEGYFEKSEYDYLTYSSEPYIAVAGVKLPEQSIATPIRKTDDIIVLITFFLLTNPP